MAPRLFEWVLWRKVSYHRRSGFRVVEETPSRIAVQKRSYGLLAGGCAFMLMGVLVSWLGLVRARETAQHLMIHGFAAVYALVGFAVAWGSRTQRDTIVVDRDRGTVRSERAKKRKKPREAPFVVRERPLAELDHLGFRIAHGAAWLSLRFTGGSDIAVDKSTDIEHLRALGNRLARVAGVELRETRS